MSGLGQFTIEALAAVDAAAEHATKRGFPYLGPEHLLVGVLKQPSAAQVLMDHGLSMEDVDDLRDDVHQLVSHGGYQPNEVPARPVARSAYRNVLRNALLWAANDGRRTIEIFDLLASLYDTSIAEEGLGLDATQLLRATPFRPQTGPFSKPQPHVAAKVDTQTSGPIAGRMKDRESLYQFGLNVATTPYIVVRLDGRAFHTYLAKATKPFDCNFTQAMRYVGKYLGANMDNAVLVYGQSDEISVLLDYSNSKSEIWFGGNIQKIVSISASMATGFFMRAEHTQGIVRGAGLPQFDSRVLCLPDMGEVSNYFIWRQRDAMRNAISMAAEARFSHKQLLGKNGAERVEMLREEGIVFHQAYDADVRRGWVAYPRIESAHEPIVYKHKRTGELITVDGVERRVWTTTAAPLFTYSPDFVTEVITRAEEEVTPAADETPVPE